LLPGVGVPFLAYKSSVHEGVEAFTVVFSNFMTLFL
jgi:hypothetical protein